MTSIGDYTFSGCSGLTSVSVDINTPLAITGTTFTNRTNATLYVPVGSKSAYEVADYWKEFKESVEMAPPTIAATSVEIGQETLTLTTEGETATLTATVLPNNATDGSVTWTSSNEAVATVSSDGVVTAVANGTATITATTNDGTNLTASCTVTVNIPQPTDEDTDISQLDNAIYVEPTEGLVGTTINLNLKMKNTLTPVGCSFMITMPEGVRLAKDDDGDVIYTLANRTKKMSLTMKDWNNGSYDFALTPSSATATITGSDDVIITFQAQIPDGMEAGDYKLRLTKCLIQSKVDDITMDTALSDVVSTLTVNDYKLGDVNGDDGVTPSDAIMTLYHYFNVEQTGFNEKAADVNGDGLITPADAIEILYMYFNAGSSNAPKRCEQQLDPQ